MPTPEISEYNRKWGICGFTSALTHLYDKDKRLRAKINFSDEDTIKLGLLTEVVTFLKYVTAYHENLIDGLEALNDQLKSEAFKNGNGVAGFIKAAEAAVRGQETENIFKNLYQCALTPEALTLYLQEVCGYKNAALTMDDVKGKAGILGLYKGKELKHWVYRAADNKVYNWGFVISPEDWKTHQAGLGYEYPKGKKGFDRVGCHISFE